MRVRTDDVAIVTGAAGGIGAAIAKGLTDRGARVVLVDRDRAALERTAATLPRATARPMDVTDASAWQGLVLEVERSHGGVDLLVSNAGLTIVGPFESQSIEDVDRIVDVNLKGVLYGCRAVAPRLRKRGRGHLVNVSSLAGRVPFPYQTTYCATKYAVRGFTAALRMERHGTRVPVGRDFAAGFEGVDEVCALLSPVHRFTAFTLQSPRAPEIPDYVALRNRVCGDDAPFLDNTLTVIADAAHEGSRGLRCFAVPQDATLAAGGHPSKSSIETEVMHFVRGDVARIELWLRVVDGLPLGLLDLETTFVASRPGPRLLVTEDGHFEGELKWGDKPRFPSLPGASTIPIGRWFRLVVELALEPDETGHMRVTVDDEVVIDADGPTLPMPNTILNSLELGLTSAIVQTTLDVDDVRVSGG